MTDYPSPHHHHHQQHHNQHQQQLEIKSEYLPYSDNNIKLAATVAMNTPYHPYPDISPTHPPSPPDDSNYHQTISGGYHNGHSGMHTPSSQIMDDLSPADFRHSHHHHHQHHHQLNNNNNSPIKLCAGCGNKISDRFLLLALERYWHNSCLKCMRCGAMLADIGSSCFTKRNLILCKKDYSDMFGSSGTCAGCGQNIPPHELVAKAMSPPLNQHTTNLDNQKNSQSNLYIFHLKCFQCSKCATHLRPGDRYTMLGGNLVCEQDWHKLIQKTSAAQPNGATPAVRKGKVGRPRRSKE